MSEPWSHHNVGAQPEQKQDFLVFFKWSTDKKEMDIGVCGPKVGPAKCPGVFVKIDKVGRYLIGVGADKSKTAVLPQELPGNIRAILQKLKAQKGDSSGKMPEMTKLPLPFEVKQDGSRRYLSYQEFGSKYMLTFPHLPVLSQREYRTYVMMVQQAEPIDYSKLNSRLPGGAPKDGKSGSDSKPVNSLRMR